MGDWDGAMDGLAEVRRPGSRYRGGRVRLEATRQELGRLLARQCPAERRKLLRWARAHFFPPAGQSEG